MMTWRCFLMIAAAAGLLLMVSCSILKSQVQPTERTLFYVSVDGSDDYPGTIERPFKTIQKARDEVRELIKSGIHKDVCVYIQQGLYEIGETLSFDARDGGGAQYEVTYAAFPGETPVLCGGHVISGWTHGQGDMWTKELSDVKAGKWWFRQLYADNQRLERGRFPEEGFLKIKNCSKDYRELTFDGTLPEYDLSNQDTEVVVIENWSISREIIISNSKNSIQAKTPIGWIGHGACLPKPEMSVFLENSIKFLTRPGQWYLDRKTGILYYKAAKGENPNSYQFIAPVLEQILRIEGQRNQPVRNLHFVGIQFAYTGFQMPDIGYAGIQACYYGTTVDDAKTHAVTPAIEMTNAEDCGFVECRISQIGGSAVGMGAGCRRNQIVGCEIDDIGGNGPMIGYMPVKDPLWADWKDPDDIPVANKIANCYIHHCGQEFYGAVGIFDAMTQGTRIVHNEVAFLPYGGISTGYVWNTELTSQRDCRILWNHVHDVMLRLYDSGAVYTLGYQPGSVIGGNLLHAVKRSGYAFGQAGNNGIFFDEGSKGFLIEQNIIYDIFDQPLRFNRNEKAWHTWKDNVYGITPEDWAFPAKGADKAGLESPYCERLKALHK